ncbi:S1/P1 nuclease [Sphingomonas sp.]|uniref:S1/P1 nuclease n=1 Tax=Sphingomonas sp. TaxID=28214 RepID=UPI002C2FDD6C|nr:S1/P1 nuclease [Sphingomonas sp.]HWK36861.1 S1/P1 nuclease [Sphingomonas sp.]
MLRRLAALFALAAAALPAPALAYWEYGHETVAKIAMANVRPSTRAAVHRLLAQSALLGTPQCPTNTIEGASTWADCIKTIKDADGKRPFDFAYNWHFQNVDVCAPFALPPACKDGDCLSAQIERDVALLKDRRTSPHDRVQALVFLIHFVGDLSQPLHAGDRKDLGGNKAASDYGVYGPQRLNLHTIWDGWLAERAISTPPSLVRSYPTAERRRIAAGSVDDWSRDSWQVARVAYASAYGDPCGPQGVRGKLDDATVAGLVAPAREQVVKGGLRLARLLDEALG